MPVTNFRGQQITDGTIQRTDLDVATAGSAVVRRLIAGTNVTFTSTGVDSGTGDVTINAASGGGASLTRVITVTPAGQGGQYNTITAAINFIVANRTLSTDYYVIQFIGVFTETITLPGNIALVGASITSSRIVGTVSINTTTTTDLNELQNFKITHDGTTAYPIRLGGAGVIIGSSVFIDMTSNSNANSLMFIDRTNKLSSIKLDDFTGNYDNTSLSGNLNFIDAASNANFPIDFRMNNAMFVFAAGPNASVGFIRVADPINTDGRAFFTNPVYHIRSSSTTRAAWSRLFISQSIEVQYVNQEVIARTFNLYPSINGLSSAPDDKNRISGTTPVFPNSRYFVNNEITEGTVFYAEKTVGDFGLYVRKPLAADFRIDVTAAAGTTSTASGVLDFGTELQTDIITTVTAAWITTASVITAVLRNSATVTDHSVEDGAIEGVSVYVVSQIAGSCVVQANSPNGSIGRYNFALIGI